MKSIETFRRNINQLLDSEEHMSLMYNTIKSGFDMWMYGYLKISFIPRGNGCIDQFHMSSAGDTYWDGGSDKIHIIIIPENKTIEISHQVYKTYGELEDNQIYATIPFDTCTEEGFFQLSLIEDLRDFEYTDVLSTMRIFNYIQERIDIRNII